MTPPKVFISPSAKEYQISPITGVNEAQTMRLLAEEIKTNLDDLGIDAIISKIGSTPNESLKDSNQENVALHLVLTSLRATSNADRGIKIYYSSSDAQSRDYATTISNNFKEIYPSPELVETEPNGSLVELIGTNSPAVVVAVGNQSNFEDVSWFDENIGDIAQNIAVSIGEVLGVKADSTPLTAIGLVNSPVGYATIRKTPSPTAKILMRIQNGAPVRIIGKIGNWYAVIASNVEGYVLASEITAETPER